MCRHGRKEPDAGDDLTPGLRQPGGYTALTRSLEMGRDAVIEEVAASGLLGRGGAAFPTGRSA